MKILAFRRLLLTWIGMMCLLIAKAQNISRVEYFFDFDPGHGNATPINFTPSTTVTVNDVAVPINNLNSGYHFLGVRVKDENNVWSPVIVRPFLKEHIPITAISNKVVNALEYFIDNDPGFGNGVPIAVNTQNELNDLVFTVPLSSIAEGVHWISVRAKDNTNNWATVVVRPFIKAEIPITQSFENIVRLEYFIDFDPGYGNGLPITAQTGTSINNLSVLASLTNIPEGQHRIFVRAKYSNGTWGTVGSQIFSVCAGTTNPNITVIGSTTVCQGQSVTLSVVSGYSYEWLLNGNPINGATSNTYQATQTGQYSVIITNNGCVVRATPVSITVGDNSLVPTVVASTITLCKGNAVELSVTNCQGTVTWNTGSTNNPLIISPTTTTNYTATCKPTGCTTTSPPSQAVQITVVDTPLNLSITGGSVSAVCSYTNTTLNLVGCTGTIKWNTGETTVSISVAPKITSTYTATCTLNACAATVSKVLTIVNPSPAGVFISNTDQQICLGESVVLSAANCQGGTINWSNGMSGSSITVSPTSTTLYTATCQIGSCSAQSLSKVLITIKDVPPTPLISTQNQTLCKGEKVVLRAYNCYGNVVWSNGIVGNTQEVIPTSTVTYTATCQNNGCTSLPSVGVVITVSDCADPATNIAAIEYFFDNDPGFGNGIPLTTFTNSSAVNGISANISVAGLSEGMHWLTIRAKDSNQKWSPAIVRPIIKVLIPTVSNLPNIVKIEYFFDTDPGFGNGINYPIAVGQQINNIVIDLPITNLNEGPHWLSVRVKDEQNKWTTVITRPFFKEAIFTPAALAEAEYFIDTDPGFGNGVDLSINPNSINGRTMATMLDSGLLHENINLTNISVGEHKLFVRIKDTKGNWGTVGVTNFFKQTNVAFVGSNTQPSSCAVNTFNIPFTISGVYNTGNTFTAQLSDRFGDFSNPVSLGSLVSTVAGTISAQIPYGTPYGDGYKIRIISSSPSIMSNPTKNFSVIPFCPPPCANLLTLSSPADDYFGQNVIKQASAANGSIIGTNKITGLNTNVIYQARTITLNSGFVANSGTVFRAEIGGCN